MGWFGSRNDNDINDFLQKNQPKYDPSIQVEKTQFNVEQPATPPVQTTKSTQISTETAQKVLAQRSIINSTALDNCEEFHIQLQECFLHGKWYDRAARMCEPQKQKFWQCVNDQKVSDLCSQ